ncbi:hypothetical protein SAMN05892883_0735 [Jatrophihabitans sp. GAS493]|uniref:hypothetical protein n=1 Tax=Jatrophihabitans sp. GAS493 TaxID=1907575 RepID=UPI000BBFC7A1|nr:hypothetical protein [Jatrophihabitans sp. GAS493]SOD71160.1 hypothetical protein SAMN05892883_0735 [Jatrophihabitans sp. GAS493]
MPAVASDGYRRRSTVPPAVRRLSVRLLTVSLLTVSLLTFGLLTAAAKPAAGAPIMAPIVAPIHIVYAVGGSLELPAIEGYGTLKPGTLAADVNLRTGELTGKATLPDIKITGAIFGFVPSVVTAALRQSGPLTGSLNPAGEVTAEITVVLALKAINAFGSMPLSRPGCRVQAPIDIILSTDGNARFRAAGAAKMVGTFATGPLVGCGSLNTSLSRLFQSVSNTLALSLTLSE